MSATPEPSFEPASLAELARLLNSVDHLEPGQRERIAALIDELDKALHAGTPPEHAAQLSRTTADLVNSLRPHQDTPLEAARESLEEAAARAEVDAPIATGVARRLIDLLSELGI
ncbi:MAG: DUF4404 family protein [Isosphaeraceae bacterium]